MLALCATTITGSRLRRMSRPACPLWSALWLGAGIVLALLSLGNLRTTQAHERTGGQPVPTSEALPCLDCLAGVALEQAVSESPPVSLRAIEARQPVPRLSLAPLREVGVRAAVTTRQTAAHAPQAPRPVAAPQRTAPPTLLRSGTTCPGGRCLAPVPRSGRSRHRS